MHKLSFLGSEGVGKTCLLAALRYLGDGRGTQDGGIRAFLAKEGDETAERYLADLAETCARSVRPAATSINQRMEFELEYACDGRVVQYGISWMDYRGEDFRHIAEARRDILEDIAISDVLIVMLSVDDLLGAARGNAYGAISDCLRKASGKASAQAQRVAFVVTKADKKPELFEPGAARRFYEASLPKIAEVAERFKDAEFFAVTALHEDDMSKGRVCWDPRGVDELFGWISRAFVEDGAVARRKERIGLAAKAGGLLILLCSAILLIVVVRRCTIDLPPPDTDNGGQETQGASASSSNGTAPFGGNGGQETQGASLTDWLGDGLQSSEEIEEKWWKAYQKEMNEVSAQYVNDDNISLEEFNKTKNKLQNTYNKYKDKVGARDAEKVWKEKKNAVENWTRAKLKNYVLNAQTLEEYRVRIKACTDYGFGNMRDDGDIKARRYNLEQKWRSVLYSNIRMKPAERCKDILSKLDYIDRHASEDVLWKSIGDRYAYVELSRSLREYFSRMVHEIRVGAVKTPLSRVYDVEVRITTWNNPTYVQVCTNRSKSKEPSWNKEDSYLFRWNPSGYSNTPKDCMIELYTYTGKNESIAQVYSTGDLALLYSIRKCASGEMYGMNKEHGARIRLDISYGGWDAGKLDRVLRNYERFLSKDTYWQEED